MTVDIDRNGMNCEKLDDDLQVSWLIEGDVITIELAGNIGRLSCVLTVISGDE